MPIQTIKDPQTGEERRVYVSPQGMGAEQAAAKPQAQPQENRPGFGLSDLTGMTPSRLLTDTAGSAVGSIGAAIKEWQRSGDLGKAYQAGQQQYMKELEKPGRGLQRITANVGRNIMQEVSDFTTADLPSALGIKGAKPTTAQQPDAPFLGVLPALPKAKSSGPVEDLVTGIVQAGVEWIPIARGIGLAGRGIAALPGVAKAGQLAAAAKNAAAATKAAQAIAKVPGAAVVGKAVASNTLTKAAATGAVVDVVGFDQYGGRLTDLIDQATKGTPLNSLAIDYLKSNPNDVGMEGRLKNALEGGLFGTALETALRTMRVARNINWFRRAPEAEKPAAAAAVKQSTQELETEVAKQAYTVPAVEAMPPVPGATRAPNPALQPPAAAAVREVDPNNIVVDAKRFQVKKEGVKAEGGVATPIADEAGYNPLKGGVVSVWTDPADGVTYVVNGHSRLAEAKASGYDRILVREIDAPDAAAARAAGALENIQESTIDPKDAARFAKQTGRTAADLAAEGIDLSSPAIAKQVEAEVMPPSGGKTPLSQQMRERLQNLGGSLADATRTIEGIMQRQEESLARRIAENEQALAEVRGMTPPEAGGQALPPTAAAPDPGRPLVKAGAELSHGTTEAGRKGILAEGFRTSEYERSGTVAGEGVYMTPSERYAGEYGNKRVGGTLPEDAKILDWTGSDQTLASLADEIGIPGPRKLNKSFGEIELNQAEQQQLKQWALDNGYDGIQYRTHFTPGGKATEVVIYNTDLANRIVGSKAAPALEAVPATPATQVAAEAPAAGPSAAEIAELDRTLAQARADLTPQQRVAVRNQLLQQKYGEPPAAAAPEPTTAGSGGEPPVPPAEPPVVVQAPVPDDNWAQRLVQQMDQQRQALEDGTVTMDDLLENNVQKLESPSGRTAYVPGAPVDAVQAYRAFSDVFSRADATGIPVMSFERIDADTANWLNRNNYDGKAVLDNLKQLSGPLGNYQENLVALRAAQLYTDHSNLQAGIAANKWLNAAADESADMGQLTAELLTAAAQQKAANVALESVTRPIGQLLYSLQNPRPRPGSLPFDEAAPAIKNIDEELTTALETEAQAPVSESIGKALSPEAEVAITTGEYTPQVLAEMDALARNMAQSAVTPGFAKGFWKQVNESVAIGARGLTIYRASQLLSSGLTLWSNTINNAIRLTQMPLSQAIGAGMAGNLTRASQSLLIYGQYVSNLQNAFRLGVESFKAGRGLYDLDETAADFLDKLAKEDLQQSMLPGAVDRKAEWDLNTMPWLDVQDKSAWAIAQKRIWQGLNLSTRTQVSLDTFFKTLAGQSFEYVRNLEPGLDRAVQQGLTPGSKEAWAFAKDYAQAAVDRVTRDVVINGRTVLDAVMESPHAQTAMRYATFTDDIWAEMGPRTYQGGLQMAEARGLKGQDAEEFARKYLESDAEIPFFARTFSMIPAAWQKLIDFSPLFSIIQPFNRTPGDIVKSVARMTPGPNFFVDTWWRDINSEDAFTRDRAIGDIALGGAAISLGTIAMTQGRLEFTGGGPADPTAKKKWRDEGKQPYSFRVHLGEDENGNPLWSDWTSMRVFEPLTSLFGALADYQEIANKLPKEARERLGSALNMDLVTAVATGQLSKTYYQGFSELYEAAMGVGELDVGPNRRNPVERYISRIIAGMVPASSLLRAGRRIEDPLVREIPPSPVEGGLTGLPMRMFEETISEIKNMIPGWSESLPPRLNWITGQPIVLSGVMGDQFLPPDQPWLATLFQFVPWSPLQQAPKQDPVLIEMAKLSGKGAVFRGPQNTDFGKELRLDPVAFNDYVMTTANVKDQFGRTIYRALNDLINSDYYKSLPDEEVSTTVMSQKAAAIDLEVQKFRKLGKEAYEAKRPDLVRDLRNIEGLNKDVQYRLKYGQPIDLKSFSEQLR